MFKDTHQTGFLSILYSLGPSPLQLWDQKVKNGHIRRVTDADVQSLALEVSGSNVATTYIICPANPKDTLGIRLPFFVMIVKNMKRYFSFEIQILDDKNQSRRFRVSNYQSTTRVRPFCTTMPIGLSSGWNQIQFNLADFTRRAYGSTYLETLRVQIHANIRIRRIYFCDRLYSEDEMPKEYKLYLPISDTKRPSKQEIKEMVDEAIDARTESQEVIPSGAPPSPVDTAHDERTTEPQIPEKILPETTEPEEMTTEAIEEMFEEVEAEQSLIAAPPTEIEISEVAEEEVVEEHVADDSRSEVVEEEIEDDVEIVVEEAHDEAAEAENVAEAIPAD